MRVLLILALALPGFAADACLTKVVDGSYGFLLWGTTTASGDPKPIASIGRVTFDGKGGASGMSSVMFTGFLLGNPLTGTYEAATDCTAKWKFQDDSGNWQNFSGKFTADGAHIKFEQTDPTAPRNGEMVRSPEKCGAEMVQNRRYSQGKSVIPGAGITVDSDCFASFQLGDDKFRGVVVDGGREILAIRSNPGPPLTARLIAVPPPTSPGRD